MFNKKTILFTQNKYQGATQQMTRKTHNNREDNANLSTLLSFNLNYMCKFQNNL